MDHFVNKSILFCDVYIVSMSFFESEENSQYAQPEWWESEYQKCKPGDTYEWFTGGSDQVFLQQLIDNIPSSTKAILNLGCGISHIQDAISDAGFHNITNVDVSASCIDLMSKSDTRGMKWQIANLTETFPFASSTFDFVLDKGTLDALIVDRADNCEPDETVYETAAQYFREIARVLTPGGIFLQISFGQPHFRRRLFEQPEFRRDIHVHTHNRTDSFHFYIYECNPT
jgi:SAM-dependent methyltransferase